MSKQRLTAIEYIRGIAMLGVIAIHVGSEYLTNPMANIHLAACFEIITRFSIPIFFFISAFGLFYKFSFDEPFNYSAFLKRRLSAVLIPYLAWTVFYIIFNQAVFHVGWPGLRSLLVMLLFGTAKYQLYFIVILLWFYVLMPLWIRMLYTMTPAKLGLILIFQVLFNYFSSYTLWTIPIGNPVLQQLINYRLNYWVFHYLFIFLLGGYLGIHSDWFMKIIEERRLMISFFFKLTLLSLLSYYYRLIYIDHYSVEAAVNTAHQLSPLGICYSAGASIFLFALFTKQDYPKQLNKYLAFFGKHSFFAYLFHPVVLTFAIKLVQRLGLIVTAPVAIIVYLSVVVFSLTAAVLVRRIAEQFPLLNKLTIGKS